MLDQQLAQRLQHIIALYGPQLVNEPHRTSALLRDLCAQHKPGEVRVLAAVAEEGLAKDLVRDGGKTSPTILHPRLAERLHDELGVDQSLALWAVTAWATALKKSAQMLDVGETTDPVSPQPQTLAANHEPLAPCGSDARPRIGASGRYLDNGDGTVTDAETGLQWMRCSLGQTWGSRRCTGKAKGYGWQEALSAVDELNHSGGYAGYRDWRVPTVEELNGLVYCSSGRPDYFPFVGKDCHAGCEGGFQQPTIDLEAFPNAEPSLFWSASPPVGESDYAFHVNFGTGTGRSYLKSPYPRVRLVRGIQ